MSRSGYCDSYGDDNPWDLIRYRGAVESAFRGRRGQAFLREMLAALDALPEKRLITEELAERARETDPVQVCAIGSVGLYRGIDMSPLDPYDASSIAGVFGIAESMAREIVYMNDEGSWKSETPEQRFERMRAWIIGKIKDGEGAISDQQG